MTRRQSSVAGRLFAAQVLIALVVAAIVLGATWVDARGRADAEAASRVLAIAQTIAEDPATATGLASADPTAALQQYTLDVIASTGIAFVTIVTPDGIRVTHPDRSRIGEPFLGNIRPALGGEAFTETFTGTLGPSVRAVVPVVRGATVVGLVAVGVLTDSVAADLVERLPIIIGLPLVVLVLGAVAAFAVSGSLRRVTGGRRADELARLVGYDEAILHTLDEGLLLLDDRRGRLLHANDRAVEIVGEDATGRPLAELPLPESFVTALTGPIDGGSGDAVHVVGGHVLVVTRTRVEGDRSVAVLRDATELRRLSGELETVRSLGDALRAQSHEHANRLHTIVTLIELGRASEAQSFALETSASAQRLTDAVVRQVHDPVVAALLLGKSAGAEEVGVRLDVQAEVDGPLGVPSGDLVTIVGNLVDNAIDAARTGQGEGLVLVDVETAGASLRIVVEDDGPGLADADRAFDRGFSTKPAGPLGRGIGLALVKAAVARLGGAVTATTGDLGGARFVVTLPRSVAAPAESPEEVPA